MRIATHCVPILASMIGAAACEVPGPTGTSGPPPGTASVAGRIRDGAGQGVPGVSVRIPVRSGHYGVTTDGKGRFAMNVPVVDLQNVSPVVVFAVKDGFRPHYGWYPTLEDGQSYNFSTPDDRPLAELEVGEIRPAGADNPGPPGG